LDGKRLVSEGRNFWEGFWRGGKEFAREENPGKVPSSITPQTKHRREEEEGESKREGIPYLSKETKRQRK